MYSIFLDFQNELKIERSRPNTVIDMFLTNTAIQNAVAGTKNLGYWDIDTMFYVITDTGNNLRKINTTMFYTEISGTRII